MFRPMNNLVQVKNAEVKPQHGIITDLNPKQEKTAQGIVIHTGDNEGILVGETVLYNTFSAKGLKLDGEQFYLVEFEDILGVIE